MAWVPEKTPYKPDVSGRKPVVPLEESPYPKPTFGESYARGMADLVQGPKQLGWKTLGMVFPELRDEADAYSRKVAEELAMYDLMREGEGFDWGRMTGQVAPVAAPTVALGVAGATGVPGVGKMAAPGMAKAIGLGGVTGGLMGASLPTQEQDEEFWPEKAKQTAFGAGAGVLAPPAVKGVGRLMSPIVRNAYNHMARFARAAGGAMGKMKELDSAVMPLFNENGVNWRALSEQTRKAVAIEANAQLEAGIGINPEALIRKAIATELGLVGDAAPMTAQLLRDPKAWSRLRNVAKHEGGESVLDRFQSQEGKLAEATDTIGDLLGGKMESEDAALAFFAQVDNRWKQMQKVVSQHYDDIPDEFRQSAVRPQTFIDMVDELRPEAPLAPIVDVADNLLERYGDDMTVDNLEVIRKKLGQLANDSTDPTNRQRGRMLIEAIDESIDWGPFQDARAAAAGRFTEFGDDMLQKILGSKAPRPDIFIEGNIIKGPTAKLEKVKQVLLSPEGPMTPELKSQYITEGRDAWNKIRGAVWNWATKPAIMDIEGEAIEFSGARFAKQWAKIPDNKKDILFTEHERELMDMFTRAGVFMTRDLKWNQINHPGSGIYLADFLMKILRKIPIGRQIAEATDEAGVSALARYELGGRAVPYKPVPNILTSGVKQGSKLGPRIGAISAEHGRRGDM